MSRIRVVLVLIGLAAIAAGVLFFLKGRAEFAKAEDVMAKRWSIWIGAGAVDQSKLDVLKKDPGWKPYQPDSAVVATPFHDEFGFYVKRIGKWTERAAIVMGGFGIIAILLAALPSKPSGAPAG